MYLYWKKKMWRIKIWKFQKNHQTRTDCLVKTQWINRNRIFCKAWIQCPFCHDPTASPSSHWKYPSQDVPHVSFVWLIFHSVSYVLVALFSTKRRCQDPTPLGFIWLAFVLTKFHINWSPTSSATASTARCLLVSGLWVAHSLSVLDNMTFVIASILVAWRNSSVVLAWMLSIRKWLVGKS